MNHPSEHAASYYASTANWQTDYPQLMGENRCDVAVVGAGFTGISTALHLAEWGYDVAVIGANRVSWGASGRNGGQLIDGFGGTEKIGKRFGMEAENIVCQSQQHTLPAVYWRRLLPATAPASMYSNAYDILNCRVASGSQILRWPWACSISE